MSWPMITLALSTGSLTRFSTGNIEKLREGLGIRLRSPYCYSMTHRSSLISGPIPNTEELGMGLGTRLYNADPSIRWLTWPSFFWWCPVHRCWQTAAGRGRCQSWRWSPYWASSPPCSLLSSTPRTEGLSLSSHFSRTVPPWLFDWQNQIWVKNHWDHLMLYYGVTHC